jgi:hypothetical protein
MIDIADALNTPTPGIISQSLARFGRSAPAIRWDFIESTSRSHELRCDGIEYLLRDLNITHTFDLTDPGRAGDIVT